MNCLLVSVDIAVREPLCASLPIAWITQFESCAIEAAIVVSDGETTGTGVTDRQGRATQVMPPD